MKKKYSLLILFLLISFQLFAQPFSEVAIESGVDIFCDTPTLMGGGVAIFDHNQDGLEDMYITGGLNPDQLYINKDLGRFEPLDDPVFDITSGTVTAGVCTGDIDNDGIREIFVYSSTPAEFRFFSPGRNYLFKQTDDGTYEEIALDIGLTDTMFTMGASFGDYNLDGYLDLYVVNYLVEPRSEKDSTGQDIFTHICWENQFYINNGDGTFTNQAALLELDDAGCALAGAFTDLNNDHYPDLMLANDFGAYIEPNAAYVNNYPDNSFSDISISSGLDAQMFGMGIAIGDFDEDLDFDYYITNIGRNVFFENNGDLTFSDITTRTNTENINADSLYAISWGCNFADFDNDSDLDLFVANGFVPTADFILGNKHDPNLLYRNNGDGTFTDIAPESGVDQGEVCRGSAVFDMDGDGDLDIVTIVADAFGEATNPYSFIYRNDLDDDNNWVKVDLEGRYCNRDAYGSKVIVYAAGRAFLREVGGGSSHTSQNSSIVHVGLGNINEIDSVEIFWVGGNRQVVKEVALNATLEIVERQWNVGVSTNNYHFDSRIYPSILTPNDALKIETSTPLKALRLFDMNGRLLGEINRLKSTRNSYELEVTDFTKQTVKLYSGVYFLELESVNGVRQTDKIILTQ